MRSTDFRLITYNLHKGFNAGNRRFTLHDMRQALSATQADFLLLQEMQGEHRRHAQKIPDWPAIPAFEWLAATRWPFPLYGKNVQHQQGHHGNAILSEWPIQGWDNINVSPYRWASRSLLHATIQLPCSSTALHLICLHFGLTGRERVQQSNRLCERIESEVKPNEPLIIAGDFNDWQGKLDHQLRHRLGLTEAYQAIHGHFAHTFPAWLPILPMDRIYFRGLALKNCERLAQQPWKGLSDHLPLIAHFSL